MELIIHRIGRIREYLNLVRSIQDECLQRFLSDPIYRGAMLHYLYLLTDGCIVLSELLIKHYKLRTPQSYAESIDILGENNIIEPEFGYGFARIAGFRNFLAHDYDRIDPEFICKEILPKLVDVDKFLAQVEKTTINH